MLWYLTVYALLRVISYASVPTSFPETMHVIVTLCELFGLKLLSKTNEQMLKVIHILFGTVYSKHFQLKMLIKSKPKTQFSSPAVHSYLHLSLVPIFPFWVSIIFNHLSTQHRSFHCQ